MQVKHVASLKGVLLTTFGKEIMNLMMYLNDKQKIPMNKNSHIIYICQFTSRVSKFS